MLSELLAILKANTASIVTVLGGIVVAWITSRATSASSRATAKKLADEGAAAIRKIDLEVDTLSMSRQDRVNEQTHKLIAHLELQLEAQAKRAREDAEEARKDREEMKGMLGAARGELGQARTEIKSLSDYVEQLTSFIRGLGHDVPRRM